MMDVSLIVPLLPLAIPLGGAGASWILPSGPFLGRLRRWTYVLTLLVTCAMLLAAPAIDFCQADLLFSLPGVELDGALQLRLGDLGIGFGSLLTGVLALAGISMLAYPMERSEAVPPLIMVLGGIWTVSAANLLTLCLGWTLTDAALLSADVIHAPEEHIPHAVRRALTNLLSSLALVMATVLIGSEHGHTQFSDLVLTGIPLKLLTLAALLRLGLYPLPGSLRRRPVTYVASICTGGYLWLRIAGLISGGATGYHWLVALCGAGLLAGGLLAALSDSWASAWPYVLLGEVASLVLAPLLDPVAGGAVAWILAINAALCIGLIGVDDQAPSTAATRRRSPLPRAVGLMSLAGWPLTLGFTAHWSYLSLCQSAGLSGAVVLASLTYLLASLPVWQWLGHVGREAKRHGSDPTWSRHVPLVGQSLVALFLVFLGIELALSARPWPGLPGELQLASLRVLFRADAKSLGELACAATVVPLAGSYILHRLKVGIAGDRSAGTFRVASALLELDWLYVVVERTVARLQRLVEVASAAVEGPFYLGWTLLWTLVIVLYLGGA